MNPDWSRAFGEFDRLYAELPVPPCTACGQCCTNPHMTFVEFARYARHLDDRLPPEERVRLLKQPAERSVHVEGNWRCRLQGADNRCLAYAARCLSCRLEGYPLMDKLAGRDRPLCPHIAPDRDYTQADIDQVDDWVARAYAIGAPFHEVAQEPYYLRMLNLDCWWAVALDPAIDQPFFQNLRRRLAEVVDVAPLAPHYADTTRLADKLRLIDRFWAENEEKKARAALKTIGRVRRDFPRIETYFTQEAGELETFMRKVVAALADGERN